MDYRYSIYLYFCTAVQYAFQQLPCTSYRINLIFVFMAFKYTMIENFSEGTDQAVDSGFTVTASFILSFFFMTVPSRLILFIL